MAKNKLTLRSQKAFNHQLKNMPSVHEAVENTTLRVALRAEELLAQHHRTGTAQVSMDMGDTDVDGFVNFDDDAVLSIEYGHFSRAGNWVPGLHILYRAAHGI